MSSDQNPPLETTSHGSPLSSNPPLTTPTHDAETLQQDSDPNEIPPAQTGATSNIPPPKDATSQTTATSSIQEDDTTSRNTSSSPATNDLAQPTATSSQETGDMKANEKDSAAAADSHPASGKEANVEKLHSSIQTEISYTLKVAKQLEQYNKELQSILGGLPSKVEVASKKDSEQLRKALIKVRPKIPPKYKDDSDDNGHDKNLKEISDFISKAEQSIPESLLEKMPQLHNNIVFKESVDFKDFEARYNELSPELKLCLLCFSVFPQKDAIIKKRLMVQWWTSEGFVRNYDDASNYFNQLIGKGFIEPVNEERSLSVKQCRVCPFYRSALITLAERANFFKFDSKGKPTQKFSKSFQMCLVGEGMISYEDYQNNLHNDFEKVHLVINVKERILEFNTKWFSKMKNVNFLHLGSWRTKDHIEVDDTKILKEVENMNYLKFLSLQGISNIIALPKSIGKLANLKILDLRACHNLEELPENIGWLKSLTHLDMSECYLLAHMPRSISSLTELRILKGFVVGSESRRKSCKLDDLERLFNLTELSIYTGLRQFPEDNHIKALGKLKKLCKLSITWGGSALLVDNLSTSSNGSASTLKLPSQLEKLDLKCFPMPITPNWLALKNLKDSKLKKLYIRGGMFSDLGQYQDIDEPDLVGPGKKNTWPVEGLRLKYLSGIEMEWRQLQELFPKLVYLEQVSCPKLTLFPCDANGVWIKP